MTHALQAFNFQDANVRTVMLNDEPWFVAKDVCDVLGIKNSRQAVSRLDEDEKGVIQNDTPGGVQEVAIVSESGAYFLIARSDKPVAREFDRWVRKEVLPAIRKTGSYSVVGIEPGSAMAILAQNTALLSTTMKEALPALTGSVIEIKAIVNDHGSRLETVEQHQRDHSPKIIDAHRQALHRCKELLVFGTKGKPQAITWQIYWRELKAHCKVSSFDLKNQAALTVPVMEKALKYAQDWCATRGVQPPSLFDFLGDEEKAHDAA